MRWILGSSLHVHWGQSVWSSVVSVSLMRVIFKCLRDFMGKDDLYNMWLLLRLQIFTATTSPLHILFSSSYLFFSDVILTSFEKNLTSLMSGCLSCRWGILWTVLQSNAKYFFLIRHGYFHILVQLICQLFLVMHFWFIIQEAMHWYIFFLHFLFCRIAFPKIDSIIILKNKAGLFWVFWRKETITVELH